MPAPAANRYGNKMPAPATKCYGDKIKQQHIESSKTDELHQPQPEVTESYHSRTEDETRFERLRSCAPEGFHELLQKVIRAVILCRPVHVYRFIADMLDVQLAKRTFDDIVYACVLKKSMKREPYPTQSCVLLRSFLEQTKYEVFGEDQFTMGPIPDYCLEKPALDRYRDYAGIGVFDMTCCELPPEPPPIQTAEIAAAPERQPLQKEPAFDKGPIPDYEPQEPALDRYRDYAGIQPFNLEDPCLDHEPLCRCTFCSMREGRAIQSELDADDSKKACAARRRAPELDPLKVFVDSPVYHEPKVRDEDAYKEGELDAIKPFGEVFQHELHFEENVFEPKSPFGEKSFTQQHPLFGDFGVKCMKCGGAKLVDDREQQLIESPESTEPKTQNDPDDQLRVVFDDTAFGKQMSAEEEEPQAFQQAFVTPESAQEAAPEANPESEHPEATETSEPAQEAAPEANPEPENPEATEIPEPAQEAAPQANPEPNNPEAAKDAAV